MTRPGSNRSFAPRRFGKCDHDLRIFLRQRRLLQIPAVGNAKPAAEIHKGDRVAVLAQILDEAREQRERVLERLHLGDLAADMHMDALHIDAGKVARQGVKRARIAPAHAEFVLGLAGRNLGVGLRVDVRVDAERDAGACAARARHLAQDARSSASDSTLKPKMPASSAKAISARVLPTPENTIFPRRNASRKRAADFALRDHIGAAAKPGERADHGEVRVRLDGVADQRVAARESLGEDAIMPLDGRGRNSNRRACRPHALCASSATVLGMQNAVTIGKMMHASVGPALIISRADPR